MVDYVERPTVLPSADAAWPRNGDDDRRRLAERSLNTVRMGADERFVRLRRRYTMAVSTLVVVFLGWYLFYLYLTAYARAFMATPVFGSVNVALLLGIGQFVSTFLLAWAFGRYAERRLDPAADEMYREAEDAGVARHGRVRRP